MSRRAKTFFTLAMFALCFATIGRAPRMPERLGDETLTIMQRASVTRAAGAN